MTATVALLPGLGADARLFDAQRRVLPDLIVPPWIEPTDGESLASFGGRLAECLPVAEGSYVGGACFGGMVALEVARHVRAKGVFLIGSCRHPAAVRCPRSLLAWVSRVLPTGVFRPRRWLRPFILFAFGLPPPPERDIFWSMALGASPRFLE